MFKRRDRFARRKHGQALVPVAGRGLPSIFLGELPKTERKLPPVYLCETGDGASCRLKWLASTCVAGMVGVCLIGVAIYASMNMDDGSGMVSSIRRASLAALQPIRGARLANDGQSPNGQKEDRIQMTSAGFVTRHMIHDTVTERQGSREFITIKPYVRIVAGLATDLPEDADKLPPFNPFKLYSDQTPVGSGETSSDQPQAVNVNLVDVPGAQVPQSDGIELRTDEVNTLVSEAAENFAYADGPLAGGQATLQLASYSPQEGFKLAPPAINTTDIHKSMEDADTSEDDDSIDEDLIASATQKALSVGKGDTLMSLFAKVDTEPTEAQSIIDALSPIFQADDLKPGEEIRFSLVPAPSDTGAMEPVKVSIYAHGGDHLATVTRNRQGDFVATTEGNEIKTQQASTRATLYTSFYHAALEQHIPQATIEKLLRVNSYDVDFKQKVKPGDTFEVFFDSGSSDDELGELLYTSMTIDGVQRKFYRFRTPDDVVDYYDEDGNSAKKFLMRNPVKGGRYTSGYGMRKHPILGTVRIHKGVDWAAPVGTPILAAGDGIIEMVGGKGGYGNYVRIRHPNGYSTAYGHMARYADGVAPGVAVKQGQIIGYVGNSGLSTGPHCHFEVLVNNDFVNPMTIAVPRGLQLQGRELAEFQRERNRIEALMQMDPVTSRVATAAQ
ncbi:MAG TPA: M23 family metallopeptidase [Methyloceanibacter sp.]|nr:M23 family metallopeptidase [Methyloceanibacter sp.]